MLCHFTKCFVLCVIMLSFIIPNVVMLSVILPSVIMLSILTLNVEFFIVGLNVNMLSVILPIGSMLSILMLGVDFLCKTQYHYADSHCAVSVCLVS
jgi:hypothetical protein